MSESIGRFIDDLHSQNYIDKHTHSFLKPPGTPRTQRMYFLKKVHKNPQGIRPIVSGCSGPTEKISAFLDHYLKPLVPLMPSYIRDSGHIISILESTPFPQDCLLVTIDVSSLYLNIPQDEGTSECLRSLENRDLMPLPKDIMQTLFDIVLKCNVFSFHTHIYQQIQGTAMGTKMAPSYANLFMDSLESSFLKDEPLQPALWKRYIDDILCVWTDSRESLEDFLHRLNSCHPTIHFTWTVSSEGVDFLDTRIYKGSRFQQTGILDVQTFFKPTNTFQYLHFSSSHPKGAFKGLVKGEAIRFLRSNSSQDNFKRTISTFRHHLLCRGYPKVFVDPLLSTVPYSLRNTYLQPPPNPNPYPNPNPNPNLNPITPRLITSYSPSLTNLYKTLTLHWDLIETNPALTLLFSKPQLSYRKEKALSNHLVSAKTLGKPPPPTTDIPLQISSKCYRVKPCHHALCATCPKLLSYHTITSLVTKHTYPLTDHFTCSSTNLIYAIICSKCSKIYIGQTSKTIRNRFRHHRAAAKEKRAWPIYRHFLSAGHDFDRDARILPLEQCAPHRLLSREIHWIKALNTTLPHGLNSQYSILE